MSVDYYVDGIMSLNQYNDKQIKPKNDVRKRFKVKKTNMEMATIKERHNLQAGTARGFLFWIE